VLARGLPDFCAHCFRVPSQVSRAKAQLKASLLLGLDGTTAVAEDIGRQLVTTGRRNTPKEIEAAVDAVSTADVMRCAKKYLWDKDIAVAAVGRVEGLLDYSRCVRLDPCSFPALTLDSLAGCVPA
jgi:processing peptidase subunit beta